MGIELRHLQPGEPNHDALIAPSYEVLNGWLFASLDEVRKITDQWNVSHNEERPHHGLDRLAMYRARLLAGLNSTLQLST